MRLVVLVCRRGDHGAGLWADGGADRKRGGQDAWSGTDGRRAVRDTIEIASLAKEPLKR